MRDKTLMVDVWWADFAGHVARAGDPRASRGVRHPFDAVVALACAAILAGRNSIAAIERWAADAPREAGKRSEPERSRDPWVPGSFRP